MKCVICGKQFKSTGSKQKICQDERCQRMMSNIKRAKNCQSVLANLPEDPIKKCPRDCMYMGGVHKSGKSVGSFTYCDFLQVNFELTGKLEPRGCDGGPECKRYIAMKKKRVVRPSMPTMSERRARGGRVKRVLDDEALRVIQQLVKGEIHYAEARQSLRCSTGTLRRLMDEARAKGIDVDYRVKGRKIELNSETIPIVLAYKNKTMKLKDIEEKYGYSGHTVRRLAKRYEEECERVSEEH